MYQDGASTGHYRFSGLPPGSRQEYWTHNVQGSWTDMVAVYEADPDDVHAAYWYLDGHPVFWQFKREIPGHHEEYPLNHVSFLRHGNAWLYAHLEIIPHKVNPATGRTEDDKRLNTATEWWYEFGPADLLPRQTPHGMCQGSWHDYHLDGGAATYEQAVLDIARKVHAHYGNDRRVIDTDQWRNDDRPYGKQ